MFDFPIFVAHLSMVLKIGEESKGKIVTESTNYLSTSDLNKEGKLDTIVVFCYLFQDTEPTVPINELLCMKNTGAQIAMDFS